MIIKGCSESKNLHGKGSETSVEEHASSTQEGLIDYWYLTPSQPCRRPCLVKTQIIKSQVKVEFTIQETCTEKGIIIQGMKPVFMSMYYTQLFMISGGPGRVWSETAWGQWLPRNLHSP